MSTGKHTVPTRSFYTALELRELNRLILTSMLLASYTPSKESAVLVPWEAGSSFVPPPLPPLPSMAEVAMSYQRVQHRY